MRSPTSQPRGNTVPTLHTIPVELRLVISYHLLYPDLTPMSRLPIQPHVAIHSTCRLFHSEYDHELFEALRMYIEACTRFWPNGSVALPQNFSKLGHSVFEMPATVLDEFMYTPNPRRHGPIRMMSSKFFSIIFPWTKELTLRIRAAEGEEGHFD